MPSSKSRVPVTLGLMTWGKEGTNGARVTDVKECEKMLDTFLSFGHNEIDTALVYSMGSSEEYLGQMDWRKKGVVCDTKLYPTVHMGIGPSGITHKPDDLRKYLDQELKSLGGGPIDMWYLHGPDRSTPYEDTLRAVNELYKEGKFKRFGISNYMSWEVAEICMICRQNGWIQPTAYQGLYNAIHRHVEPELFPCLRKFGLSFYEFNPLAGGFLTGKYTKDTDQVEEGSRFDGTKAQGKMYRQRYFTDHNFRAVEIIRAAADRAGLTMPEVALRWMNHHSLMDPAKGDNIIIGASSTDHLVSNLKDFEKGPLPQEVVDACDEAWQTVKGVASKYWH